MFGLMPSDGGLRHRPLRGRASTRLMRPSWRTTTCLLFVSRCPWTTACTGLSRAPATSQPTVRSCLAPMTTGVQPILPAVIPDYTRMLWYVRAPSYAQLEKFRERVVNCFK
jgi:hypothetical protein